MSAHPILEAAISPTRFAAQALGIADQPPPKGQVGRASSCWLCGGATEAKGWRLRNAIAGTFTQHNAAVFPDSDAICQPCVALTRAEVFQRVVAERRLPIKIWAQAGWHSYSHVVAGDGTYEAPKPGRLRALLLDPPEPPFLIGLNPSGQKHSVFRSRVAGSRDLYPVHMDERTFHVDRPRFASLLANLEALSALGIGKEQSASGRYHPESLRRAGLAHWQPLERRMARWRAMEPDMLALAAWVGRGAKWFADNREVTP